MKIAISIPDNVFRDVKKVAEEQKRSRSEVIVEAVRRYLKNLETRRMINNLNEVYSSPDTEEERAARAADLELYRRAVLAKEKEEW
jgi:metal-responsive CopG/Arc/MetJ family transcriptional regulator